MNPSSGLVTTDCVTWEKRKRGGRVETEEGYYKLNRGGVHAVERLYAYAYPQASVLIRTLTQACVVLKNVDVLL